MDVYKKYIVKIAKIIVEAAKITCWLEEIGREIQEEEIDMYYTSIEIDKEFYNFKRGVEKF